MISTYYSKAPITEALIDLRVTPHPDATAVDIAIGLAPLKETFPLRQELPAEQQFQFSLGPEGAAFGAGPLLSGFRYLSADRRAIIIARSEGFVYSTLCEPSDPARRYDQWTTLRDAARRYWEQYRASCQPKAVVRAAVRYVNRLDIPVHEENPTLELSDYLNVYPQEPSGLSYHASVASQCQVVMPQLDIEAVASVSVVPLTASSETRTLAVLLDIDLYRENLAWEALDDTAIWSFMEKLHERKNDVFEACITEKTREFIR